MSSSNSEEHLQDDELSEDIFLNAFITSEIDYDLLAAKWTDVWNNDTSSALHLLKYVLEQFSRRQNVTKKGKPAFILNENYQTNLRKFFKKSMTLEVFQNTDFMNDLYNILVNMSRNPFCTCRLTAATVVFEIYTSLLQAEQVVSEQLAIAFPNLMHSGDPEFNDLTVKKRLLICQLKYLITTVINQVWRDVETDVRMLTLKSIVNWILMFPSMMAVDEIMKYVTWLLVDNVGNIRLCAVESIKMIVEGIDDKNRLACFLSHSTRKLSERLSDINSRVAAAAIGTLRVIDSTCEGFLLEHTFNTIYQQVYSNKPNIAGSAALFLSEKIDEENESNCIPNVIQFQLEAPPNCYGEFLISAILKYLPSLTNWDIWMKCFTHEDDLRTKKTICELMLHTIRMSATLERPPWENDEYIVYKTKEELFGVKNQSLDIDQITEEMCLVNIERITNYFSNRIIDLIEEYKEESNYVIYFLQIPQFFDHRSNSEVMLQIIDYMQNLTLSSEDIRVINNSIYNLTLITNKMSGKDKERALEKQEKFVKMLVEEFFVPTVKEMIKNKKSADQSSEIGFERVLSLAICLNLTNTPVFDLALEGLKTSIEAKDCFGVKIFANICYHNIIYKLRDIINLVNSSLPPSEEEVQKLKMLCHSLLNCTIEIISKDFSKINKCLAFTIWCNILTIFSKHEKMSKLPQAVIQPSPFDTNCISTFINTTVPKAYKEGETPSTEDICLLTQYCDLLAKCVLPASAIVNILPFFETVAYHEILTKPLLTALYHPLGMEKAIISIVLALGNLQDQYCERKITEKALQGIVEGVCLSLQQKRPGFDNLILQWQITGLEYIRRSGKKNFFLILDFFIPLISQKNSIIKLQELIKALFPNMGKERVLKIYLNSLEDVLQEIE